MTALLLTALFAFAAIFAFAAMVGTWCGNAGAILSLRQQLRECADMRDFRYSLTTREVRSMGASIHRPAFAGSLMASRRPLREEPLRAAA